MRVLQQYVHYYDAMSEAAARVASVLTTTAVLYYLILNLRIIRRTETPRNITETHQNAVGKVD